MLGISEKQSVGLLVTEEVATLSGTLQRNAVASSSSLALVRAAENQAFALEASQGQDNLFTFASSMHTEPWV